MSEGEALPIASPEDLQEASSIRYVVGVRLAQLSTNSIAVYNGTELKRIVPAGEAKALPEWLQVVLWDESVERDRQWMEYERYQQRLREPALPQHAAIAAEDAGGL